MGRQMSWTRLQIMYKLMKLLLLLMPKQRLTQVLIQDPMMRYLRRNHLLVPRNTTETETPSTSADAVSVTDNTSEQVIESNDKESMVTDSTATATTVPESTPDTSSTEPVDATTEEATPKES